MSGDTILIEIQDLLVAFLDIFPDRISCETLEKNIAKLINTYVVKIKASDVSYSFKENISVSFSSYCKIFHHTTAIIIC